MYDLIVHNPPTTNTMCQNCLDGGFHQTSDSTNPLLANNWHPFAKDQIDDGVVHVHFDRTEPKLVKKFIRNLIKDVDEVTGIKVQRGSQELADIDLFGVERWEGDLEKYNISAAGLAYWDIEESNFDGTWKNRSIKTEDYTIINKRGKRKTRQRLTDYSERLITHEFLHTMGLSHPENDGYAKGYNGTTTTMSYNRRDRWTEMTPMDITALQEVWGAPSDTTFLF